MANITSDKKESQWKWEEGIVNTSNEHVKIIYGSINFENVIITSNLSDYTKKLPTVALVYPSEKEKRTFIVQFFDNIGFFDVKKNKMYKDVKKDLDFYLVENAINEEKMGKGGPKRVWAYINYHCTTTANVYSNVHWIWIKPENKT